VSRKKPWKHKHPSKGTRVAEIYFGGKLGGMGSSGSVEVTRTGEEPGKKKVLPS